MAKETKYRFKDVHGVLKRRGHEDLNDGNITSEIVEALIKENPLYADVFTDEPRPEKVKEEKKKSTKQLTDNNDGK